MRRERLAVGLAALSFAALPAAPAAAAPRQHVLTVVLKPVAAPHVLGATKTISRPAHGGLPTAWLVLGGIVAAAGCVLAVWLARRPV